MNKSAAQAYRQELKKAAAKHALNRDPAQVARVRVIALRLAAASGKNVTFVGNSQVSRGEGGCSILERWDGAGGSTGTSINYYQPSSDQWHQLWVGSNGTLIDIAGGVNDGVMQLEGTIEYIAQERIEAFRGTWSVLPDGRVRQHLEEFSLAAQSWQTWFDGYYRLVSRQ